MVAAGWAGLAIFAASAPLPPIFPRAGLCVVLVVAATSVLCALLSTAAPPVPREGEGLLRSAGTAIRSGIERGFPAAAPLVALPLTRLLPRGAAPAAAALFALAAGIAAARGVPHEGAPAARSRRDAAVALAVLGLTLAACALYVGLGARAGGNHDNDGAYYYGVARHMVLARRFEEPLVWHFLAPPASLLHPPFDYWGSLTSLLLVPALAVFGATHHVAAAAMTVLSILTLLALARLVAADLGLGRPLVACAAALIFAFSPWMRFARFDTESLVPFQLCLLGALIARASGRLALAAVLAFGMVLARAEGVVLCGLLWAALALAARRGRDRRAMRGLAIAMGASVAGYVLWQLAAFGTPLPPGLWAARAVRRYADLYAYAPAGTPGPALPFDAPDTVPRAIAAVKKIGWVPLPLQSLWLALSLVPPAGAAIRRWVPSLRPRETPPSEMPALVSLLLLLGIPLLLAATPAATFNAERSLATFTPLAVLAGAAGADEVLGLVVRLIRRWPAAGHALAGAAAAALLCAAAATVAVYPLDIAPEVDEFARIDALLNGEPTASNYPWQVAANTRSPAVSLPGNGEAAMEAVLRRYGVRWVVLLLPSPGADLPSRVALARLLAGKATAIGGVHLAPALADGRLRVYRVVD